MADQNASKQDANTGKCPVAGGASPLGRISLTDPEVVARPQDFFRAMRTQDPVFFDERIGMYLVSRYEEILEVLRDPITYSDKMGYEAMYASGHFEEFRQILERDGGGFFPDVIKDDPPAHTRVRRLMEQAFTAHRVAVLEPAITAVVADQIEKIALKAETGRVVDCVHEFGNPVTIRVICEQLGISQFNADKLERWSQAVTAQLSGMQNRERMLENAKQICELQTFLIAEMKARQAQPREDMISHIVHAKLEDGGMLTFEEAVSLVRALIIAGNDTTGTAIGTLMFILATQPNVAEALRDSADDERLMTRFVEEMLRYAPPVQGLAKMTSREVELGGKKLPPGAHILVMYASGNDDEKVFECPRTFDMNRKNLGKQMAFGVGVHRCIGASLARMEIKVAAREVIKRLDNFKLMIPIEEITYMPTVATHTIKALPLTFTRRQ
jgi:cytochrome P450